MTDQQAPTRDDRLANRYRLWETFRDMTALYAAIAVLALVVAGVEWTRGRELSQWPATDGRVVALDTYDATVRGRVLYTIPAVRLVYAYQVDGREYEAERVRPDEQPIAADSELGQALLRDYAVGSPIVVRYDPADPAAATILTENPDGAASAVLPMALLVGVVAAAAVLTRLLARGRGAAEQRPPQ